MSGSTPSSASSSSQPPFEVRKVGEIGQPIEVFVKMGQQTYKFSYIPPEGYAVTGSTQADQIEKIRTLATDILKGLGAEQSTILQKTEKMDFKFTEKHAVTSIEKSSNGTPSAGFKEDETIQKVEKAFETFQKTSPIEKLPTITAGSQTSTSSLASQPSAQPTLNAGSTASLTAMDDTVAVTTPIAGSSTTASRGVCGLKPLTQRDSSKITSSYIHYYGTDEPPSEKLIQFDHAYYKSEFDDVLKTAASTLPLDKEPTPDEITAFKNHFSSLSPAFKGHIPVEQAGISDAILKTLPRGLQNPSEACYVHTAVQNILAANEQSDFLFASLNFIITRASDDLNPTIEGLTPEQIKTKIPDYIADTKIDDSYQAWDLKTLDKTNKIFCKLTIKQAATIAKTILNKIKDSQKVITEQDLDAHTMQVLKMCLLKLQAQIPSSTQQVAGAASTPSPIVIPHIDKEPYVKPDDASDVTDFQQALFEGLNKINLLLKERTTSSSIHPNIEEDQTSVLLNPFKTLDSIVKNCSIINSVDLFDELDTTTATSIDLTHHLQRSAIKNASLFTDRKQLSLEIPILRQPSTSLQPSEARPTPLKFTHTTKGNFKVSFFYSEKPSSYDLDSFSVHSTPGIPEQGGHTWSYRRVNVSANPFSSDLRWIRIDDREDPIVCIVQNEEVEAALSGNYKNVYPTYLHFTKNEE